MVALVPAPLTPATLDELAAAVRSAPRVIAVGAGTKPRLAEVGADVVRISTAKLSGIVDYEPSEFTFTALAGTPLREIVAALGEKGQYLPFDPPLAEAGATLGGTVAAGLSGPGRFRFGGLRDFILGVRFVDGEGRLVRLGGRVVKNAAGFDVPKFFVGSAGRFGVFGELTFKVFPRPLGRRTLCLPAADAAAITAIFAAAGAARWELDALEADPAAPAVWLRLGGAEAALDVLVAEILARWPGRTVPAAEAAAHWAAISEFGWAPAGGTLAKFALTPGQVPAFAAALAAVPGAKGWIGAGGNVGYAAVPTGTALPAWSGAGVTLRGAGPLWLGAQPAFAAMRAVKAALDPANRFPGLDETGA